MPAPARQSFRRRGRRPRCLRQGMAEYRRLPGRCRDPDLAVSDRTEPLLQSPLQLARPKCACAIGRSRLGTGCGRRRQPLPGGGNDGVGWGLQRTLDLLPEEYRTLLLLVADQEIAATRRWRNSPTKPPMPSAANYTVPARPLPPPSKNGDEPKRRIRLTSPHLHPPRPS